MKIRNTHNLPRITLHALFLSIISTFLIAWGNRGFIKNGNRYFAQGQYHKAVEEYRQADDSPIAHYDLGNAFYRLRKYKDAIEEYHHVLISENSELQEKAFYNLGNAQLRSGDLQSAIKSYKNALRRDPNDQDAKYNLEYVIKTLEVKRSAQSSEQKRQDQRKSDKVRPQDKKPPQNRKMSKEDVRRVLNVIRKEEKELQRKRLKRKLLDAKTALQKDW